MIRLRFLAGFFLQWFLIFPVAFSQTLPELVQKNIAARGGLKPWLAIKSYQAMGRHTSGGGQFQTDVGILVQGHQNIRTEANMQGMTEISVSTGPKGWTVNPFGGRKDAEMMPPDALKSFNELSDLGGWLMNAQLHKFAMSDQGLQDIDGTMAHTIRIDRGQNEFDIVWLDPVTFLEIRGETHRYIRGSLRVMLYEWGEYTANNGLIIPMAEESWGQGESERNKTSISKVMIDVPVDASIFQMPKSTKDRSAQNAILALKAKESTEPKQEKSDAPPPAAAAKAPKTLTEQAPVAFDAGVISGLGIRNIGSAAMSGRIAALAGMPGKNGQFTLYVGAASGGVWKSIDSGMTFQPVFDAQPVQSIGAITIAPSQPETVWVGTGEAWTRNSVSIGNGIYKSIDGGQTWKNMGLPGSERIVRILVHPKNPDIVYACVPGKLWSDSADRGLYKTSDGGMHWNLILKGSNLSTGCASAVMDPANPDFIYASLWDFRRKGWTFRSGGESPTAASGSQLLHTSDGGKTWAETTPGLNSGFPAKPYGRIEVTIAPSQSKRIYAFVEAHDSALYISDDSGRSWQKGDKSQWMVWRPFYFSRLVVDPKDPNHVFKMNGAMIVSSDGGQSFAATGGFQGMHGDVHDLWIDPNNSKHMIAGDDGGLWSSYDGGSRWVKHFNLPISQFYHVSVDNEDPYRVYGGLQDNGSWIGQSAYPSGISNAQWETVYGGDGFWVFADPSDSHYVYAESQGGELGRVHRTTHEVRPIKPTDPEKLRFNWNTPLALSPQNPDTLYIGSQFLFRTTDKGQTWQKISPDLTTNNPEKKKQEESGGITVDNSAAEMHTTIYSISESPKDDDVIWVGTDDGLIQMTKNGGKTWTNLTSKISDLGPDSWVSWVEAGAHDRSTVFACFDRHTVGDMEPYVYRSRDLGVTWTQLVGPKVKHNVRGYAHVIKQDPVNPSVLYLGTEFGLWISIDDGQHWAEFRANDFPRVAVRDIAIQSRDNDLILATHGRGMWIIDDITPLRNLSKVGLQTNFSFLESRPVQQRLNGSAGFPRGSAEFVGENPREGAVITWYQRNRQIFGKSKLEILDSSGQVLDELSPSKRRGINRLNWSMRVKPPRVPPAVQLADAGSIGPRVLPGIYTAKLTSGEEQIEMKFKVDLDRRATYSVSDRKEQFAAAMQVHHLFGEESALIERLALLSKSLQSRIAAPNNTAVKQHMELVLSKIDSIKKEIVATKEGGAITGEQRLREFTDELYGNLIYYEGKPGAYQLERIEFLRLQLKGLKNRFEELLQKDLADLNAELKSSGSEMIAQPPVIDYLENTMSSEQIHWLQAKKLFDFDNDND